MQQSLIQKHWKSQELPHTSCIAFSDDRLIVLTSFHFIDPNNNDHSTYYISPLCEAPLENFLKYNPDMWVEITVYDQRIPAPNGGFYICGEGAMGSDGFVAHVSASEELIWAFFSDSSNPFFKLEQIGDRLIAYSTSELCYEFDLNAPEKISVSSLCAIDRMSWQR